MDETNAVEIRLEVGSSDATEEELDTLTRDLLNELKQTDINSASLVNDVAPEAGRKGDLAAASSIAIAVLPVLLPKIVETIQAWIMRGSARTVKFKGKVMGQTVDFEGSSEDLHKLLASLPKGKTKK